MKADRDKNKERNRDSTKKRQENNKEHREAYRKAYYLKNIEKERADGREYGKKYYAKNREKVLAYARANAEKRRAYMKVYTKANPEVPRRNGATRRVRKLNVENKLTLKDVRNQYCLQIDKNGNYTCYWCRKSFPKKQTHIDHVIPLSKGGKHDASNIVVACKHCNLTKSASMPADFAGKLL